MEAGAIVLPFRKCFLVVYLTLRSDSSVLGISIFKSVQRNLEESMHRRTRDEERWNLRNIGRSF